MKRRTRLLTASLLLCLPWWSLAADDRQMWFSRLLSQDNPVRAQLAVLSHPDAPLTIRIYRGPTLENGKRVSIGDAELALSEGLLDELYRMDQTKGPFSGRWSLLFVLAYLGARASEQSGMSAADAQAQALLLAANQIMASAWEEAGRPHHDGLRAQQFLPVLTRIPYAAALNRFSNGQLHRDPDGFVLDSHNLSQVVRAMALPAQQTRLE